MFRTLVCVAALTLFAMPMSIADDLAPVACIGGVHEGPVQVDGLYCQASACDPAAACQGEVHRASGCGVNETIQGQTCQSTTGAELSIHRPINLPVLVMDVPVASVRADLLLTDGNAQLGDLPNAWTSDALSVSAAVAGVDLGTTDVAVYRTIIVVPASDGELQHALFPDSNNTFSDVAVEVDHADSAGTLTASAGILLLDLHPTGCFVRSNVPSAPNVDCPRFPTLP